MEEKKCRICNCLVGDEPLLSLKKIFQGTKVYAYERIGALYISHTPCVCTICCGFLKNKLSKKGWENFKNVIESIDDHILDYTYLGTTYTIGGMFQRNGIEIGNRAYFIFTGGESIFYEIFRKIQGLNKDYFEDENDLRQIILKIAFEKISKEMKRFERELEEVWKDCSSSPFIKKGWDNEKEVLLSEKPFEMEELLKAWKNAIKEWKKRIRVEESELGG